MSTREDGLDGWILVPGKRRGEQQGTTGGAGQARRCQTRVELGFTGHVLTLPRRGDQSPRQKTRRPGRWQQPQVVAEGRGGVERGR